MPSHRKPYDVLYELHLLGAILTLAVSAVAARWVDRQTSDRAGRVMVLLLLIHVAMGGLLAGELLASSLLVKRVFSYLVYWLVLVTPVVWFLFAVYYTGREYWLRGPVWALLATSVGVPTVLMATQPLHGLVVAESRLVAEPFVHLAKELGAFGMVLLGLQYLYLVVAVVLLMRLFLYSRRTYRWQIVGMVVGIAAIVAGMVLTASDWAPLRMFPYGVFGAAVFGVTVAGSLFRTNMFAVAPLARDRLFESLDDAIVVVDADRRIVDFNRAAATLFADIDAEHARRLDDVYPMLVEDTAATDGGGDATTHDEAVGTPIHDGAGGTPIHDDAVTPADPTATPFAETFTSTGPAGDRTFRVTTSEITSGGEPRGYALIIRDVSALEAYARDLERKTEQLEQFASVLSHDLRNPVAIAEGFIELELDDRGSEGDSEAGSATGDERGSDNLRQALDAVERIDEIIGDLLRLAREGDVIDDPSEVVLATVVEDAWAVSDTGEVTLESQLANERILADVSRLRTMLENLFRNAADHGGGRVTVGWLDDRAGFFVEDDGPGIPAADRDEVFAYGVSKDGGTGIGLATVAAIADAHGWSVAVTDGRDGGARFEVRGVTTA